MKYSNIVRFQVKEGCLDTVISILSNGLNLDGLQHPLCGSNWRSLIMCGWYMGIGTTHRQCQTPNDTGIGSATRSISYHF